MTAPAPDCVKFGCIGIPRCHYCDADNPSPEAQAVRTATARLRRRDLLGALRVLVEAGAR
jgi:hypothetical protein